MKETFPVMFIGANAVDTLNTGFGGVAAIITEANIASIVKDRETDLLDNMKEVIVREWLEAREQGYPIAKSTLSYI